MGQRESGSRKSKTICGNGGLLLSRAQDPDVRSGRPAQITQLRCQRKFSQDILRDGSGDLLMNRFGLMMKNDGFHDQRPLDKARWTSEKQIRCADAQ